MVLLQSTFTCLLEVTLSADFRLEKVRKIDGGHGVYFGLSRDREKIFAVARNTDVNGHIVDANYPTSTLITVHSGKHWAIPETRGLHQIRCHDGLVWLMNCRDPELVVFDPERGSVIGTLSLAPLVPAELQHPIPQEHPTDRYHFNSLFFMGGRLFLLAHNWGYGSFALEMEYPGLDEFLARPRVVQTHTDLGNQAHDIYVEDNRLHVLDSGNGRLLIAGKDSSSSNTEQQKQSFARGLAVNANHFFIGHGSFAKREDRVTGPTQISVIDRGTLELLSVVDVGPFGNPCDLMIMSERDWSDETGICQNSSEVIR